MLDLQTLDIPIRRGQVPAETTELAKSAAETTAWLLTEAISMSGPTEMFSHFCEKVREAGILLDRALLAVETRHSEQAGLGWFWEPGMVADLKAFPYDATRDEVYQRSPFAKVHETSDWLRLNLPETSDDAFGIVPELKESGLLDYICLPLPFEATKKNGMTLATGEAGGFTEDQVQFFKTVLSAFKLVAEVMALNRRIETVLRTYVGEEPQKRILAGDIHLGEVVRIRSAVMFIDMRNFTKISMNMNAQELAGFLNRYYDCLVPSIEACGGEVLKFVGDGVLAVFRTGGKGAAHACQQALAAAQDVLDAVNRERNGGEGPRFSVKIALHFGRVAYGNIGSGQRLDFTVIGRDVNVASRLTTLCGQVERSLLVSGAFRDRTHNLVDFIPAGAHSLRGVPKKLDVYEPAV